jgi:hypothetical protein
LLLKVEIGEMHVDASIEELNLIRETMSVIKASVKNGANIGMKEHPVGQMEFTG